MAPMPDVLILCGGLQTRFRPVSTDIPKCMAMVDGRPFLDLLLDFFLQQGCSRFILCTGYKGESIARYYEQHSLPTSVLCSRETVPLGTAGAIQQARPLIQTEPFIVANGDSYCAVDLKQFLFFHQKSPGAIASMALSPLDGRTDVGAVALEPTTRRLTAFEEKGASGRYLNAGVYVFAKKVFNYFPQQQPSSLEYALFPTLLPHGLYGFVTSAPVLDIGTPERYTRACAFFRSMEESYVN